MALKFSAKVLIAGLLVLGTACAAPAKTDADEAAIKAAIKARFPESTVDSIRKTPFDGLYEFVSEGQIFYIDKNVNFLLVGRLIDAKNRSDLTEKRMRELSQVKFDTLPLDDAIKVVKGNGKRRLAVFSDPDCPYCKRLEDNLTKVNNVTVYIFLRPIESLHAGSTQKAKAIWCAPDRVKAWEDTMLRGIEPPAGATCKTPVEKIKALADHLRVTGTPTLIFANGLRVPGAIPAAEIEKILADDK